VCAQLQLPPLLVLLVRGGSAESFALLALGEMRFIELVWQEVLGTHNLPVGNPGVDACEHDCFHGLSRRFRVSG